MFSSTVHSTNNTSRSLDAIVLCVVACGFEPRCTLELTDAGEVRIENIYRLIAQCNHSIHDISRTEIEDQPYRLPLFNMPLELGIFLGAKRDSEGVTKARVINPRSKGSVVKAKFAHPAKRDSDRRASVREKSARYRSKK
jgi:hypothetical protein